MIAKRKLWRWRVATQPVQHSYIEVTKPGQRCDWTQGGVYEQLGWCVPAPQAGQSQEGDR